MEYKGKIGLERQGEEEGIVREKGKIKLRTQGEKKRVQDIGRKEIYGQR